MTEDDYLPPSPAGMSLSGGTAAGFAGLMIGCTLLVSACVLMVFNILLFSRGFGGIPIRLAQLGGAVGVPIVALSGGMAVVLGLKGWTSRESGALGAAAVSVGSAGLAAWLIAGINLLIILFSAS